MNKNEVKVTNLGLVPVYHYEGKDSYCLILDPVKKKVVAKGMRLCSVRDTSKFSRAEGRNVAFGRAMQALAHQTNVQPIKADAPRTYCPLVVEDYDRLKVMEKKYGFKGLFLPALSRITAKEKALIENKLTPKRAVKKTA